MLTVVRFKAEHMRVLSERPKNAHLKTYLNAEALKRLEENIWCYTILDGERVLMCGGLAEYWNDRAEAWAVFTDECKSCFLALHRIVKRYLDCAPFRRIEAAVTVGFAPGHRWMKSLGFELEANRLKAYRPSGEDCALYAKVKHG